MGVKHFSAELVSRKIQATLHLIELADPDRDALKNPLSPPACSIFNKDQKQFARQAMHQHTEPVPDKDMSSKPLHLIDSCMPTHGHTFGFSQPVALGEIFLEQGGKIPVKQIDKAMQHMLSSLGPPPENLTKPTDALTLCQWLLDWGHQLHLISRIPVIQAPRLISSRTTASGLIVRFAAPYIDASLSREVYAWVAATMSAIASNYGNENLEEALKPRISSLNALQAKLRPIAFPGVNSERILRSAIENDIPFTYMSSRIFVFGQGKHARWLNSTFTDATSHLGAILARNKIEAAAVLNYHGLPVARNMLVRDENEAVAAAHAIGYPVVVKAANLDGGIGVHAGLKNPSLVRQCFAEARRHTTQVMVEKFQPGCDYRLTVVHGRVIKCVQRIAGGISGDGSSTVSELLQASAQDTTHQRRLRERKKDTLLALDAEALELLHERAMTADSVPAAGEFIALRRRANVSSGGSTRSVALDEIHPDNQRLAERATTALRLDVAGIDLILPDIRRSWFETGGIVCEVNGQPQLGENNSPGLYRQFFHSLLGGDGRIPISVVACSTAPDSARIQAWSSAFGAGRQGSALIAGGIFYLNGQAVSPLRRSPYLQVRAAMASTEVERLLVLMSMDEFIAHGVPASRIDTLVIGTAIPDQKKLEASITPLLARIAPHVLKNIHLAIPLANVDARKEITSRLPATLKTFDSQDGAAWIQAINSMHDQA